MRLTFVHAAIGYEASLRHVTPGADLVAEPVVQIDGRPARRVFRDDGDDPDAALRAAEEWLAQQCGIGRGCGRSSPRLRPVSRGRSCTTRGRRRDRLAQAARRAAA